MVINYNKWLVQSKKNTLEKETIKPNKKPNNRLFWLLMGLVLITLLYLISFVNAQTLYIINDSESIMFRLSLEDNNINYSIIDMNNISNKLKYNKSNLPLIEYRSFEFRNLTEFYDFYNQPYESEASNNLLIVGIFVLAISGGLAIYLFKKRDKFELYEDE